MSQTESHDERHWKVGIPGLAPESERAQLVILFTDIAGSTKLKDSVPEDDYHELLCEHDAILEGIITHDEAGTCVKHTGDGYLAVFRETGVAVLRALEMQRAMRDHKLSMRVGSAGRSPGKSWPHLRHGSRTRGRLAAPKLRRLLVETPRRIRRQGRRNAARYLGAVRRRR